MTALLTLLLLCQSPEDLRAVFSQQAEVSIAGSPGQWARLPLPDAVLRQVDRDLADVRLVNDQGALVPFVIQKERPRVPELEVWLVQSLARRKETPAGPGTPNVFEETAVFELPAARGRTPRLQLSTSSRSFVRRAQLEALTQTGAVVGHLETTLFRLPGAGERLELWWPSLERSAVRLRLTLSGQDDGFLSPALSATFSEAAPPETTLEWPITEAPLSDGRSTAWSLDKPRGIVPMRLALTTSTPWFNRVITVRSQRGVLGRGRVFRQAGLHPIDHLELPLLSTNDERLEVQIEDEDSPPLADLHLAFVIEQPELVFTVPPARPVTLYFGGHRTRRARFDTSDFEVRLPEGLEASTLKEIKPNPQFVRTPVLAAFRKAGAAVAVKEFSKQAWVRRVGDDEVSSVEFTAAHAQTMSADFHELRLVDAQGLQWPFVLRETTAAMLVQLTRVPAPGPGRSAWTFFVAGRVSSLALIPPAGSPYFSREVSVFFRRDGEKRQLLWSGALTSNPSDRGARTELLLPLDGSARGKGAYTLELDDGGDAPLTALALEATVQVPRLTALLAAGDYRALWGAAAQRAPHYDLERVSDVLEELRTTPRAAASPEPNPAFVAPSLLERTGGATRWLFWATLALAVLVLGGLTVRIARAEPGAPPPAT